MKAELARLEQLQDRICRLIERTAPICLMVSNGTRWIGLSSDLVPVPRMMPISWKRWLAGSSVPFQFSQFSNYIVWCAARSPKSVEAWKSVFESVGSVVDSVRDLQAAGPFGEWIARLRDANTRISGLSIMTALAEACADGVEGKRRFSRRCKQVIRPGLHQTFTQSHGSFDYAKISSRGGQENKELGDPSNGYFIEAIEDAGRSLHTALQSFVDHARATSASRQAVVNSPPARQSERSQSQDSTRKKRGSGASYARSKAKPGRDKSQSHPRSKRFTLSDRDKNIIVALSEHKMVGRQVANPPDHATLAKWAGYAPNSHFKRALANLVKRKYLDNGRRHGEQGGYWLTPKGVRAAQRASS